MALCGSGWRECDEEEEYGFSHGYLKIWSQNGNACVKTVRTLVCAVWAAGRGRGPGGRPQIHRAAVCLMASATMRSLPDNPISISPLTTHHCSRSRTLHTSHKKKTARARTWRMHAYTIANRGLGVLCHPFRPPVSASAAPSLTARPLAALVLSEPILGLTTWAAALCERRLWPPPCDSKPPGRRQVCPRPYVPPPSQPVSP